MSTRRMRKHRLVVLLAALLACQAFADVDEAWLLRSALPAEVRPLLVLLVDNSPASHMLVQALPPYEPGRDYGRDLAPESRCDRSRIYWRRGAGSAPDCRQQAGVPVEARADQGFGCRAARAALAETGYFVASRAAQWRDGDPGRWDALRADGVGSVECRAERELDWDRAPLASPYIFYAGNYLNYLRAGLSPQPEPFASLVRRKLVDALRANDGLEAAIWRFAPGADGGFAVLAGGSAATAAGLIELHQADAEATDAPLAELLAETASWLSGSAVRFGALPEADPAAFEAGRSSYRSPFTHPCRPLTLAVVSAGSASGDESAASAAAALPRFMELTDGCAENCLAALARYLEQADLLAGLPGRQAVPVHWLLPSSIQDSRTAPTGHSVQAEDALAFTNLVARSLQHDVAVPAGPYLSAAGLVAASRTSHEAIVVHGLSAPIASERWAGNLFRYGMRAGNSPLTPPVIVDRDGEPAIDAASGLPGSATRSAWSDAPDANLLAGGAAGRLPEPASRRIYSDVASLEITDPRNRLMPGQDLFDRGHFGLGLHDAESVDEVIAWLLASRRLGDPGPLPPVVARYPAAGLAIAFAVTQDGLLHAFDFDSGIERWAWIPQALLPRLPALMRDEATAVRSHGIDGPLILHRHDPDGDGHIDSDAGEHLWLMFGFGRGGNQYVALDISTPDEPVMRWSVALPSVDDAQSPAEPVIARLAIAETMQSEDQWVVLLAGGPGLHVFDAESGRRLWSAAPWEGAELRPAGFGERLASAPRVLDLDGDGRIDRAYLLDAGGGLWRLNFRNGTTAPDLGSARKLARLGDGGQRFYAPPDVSIAMISGRRELALAAGSGRPDRASSAMTDRVYLIIDRDQPGTIAEDELHDATARDAPMPPAAPGWYIRLDTHGAGERVAGPAVTFDHVLRFQTWQPLPNSDQAPCGPPRSVTRLYARDVRNGLPLNHVERPDEAELEQELPGYPVILRFGFPAWLAGECAHCRPRPFGLAGSAVFDAGYAGDPVRTSWRRLPPDSP